MDPTDENAPSARRPRRWLLFAAAAVALVALAWTSLGSDTHAQREATQDRTVDRSDTTRTVLDSQQAALDAGDRSAFLATWTDDPGSRQQAERVFDNLRSLDADVTLTMSSPDDGIADLAPAASWQVIVSAEWQQPRVRTRPAVNPLQYTFEPEGPDAGKVADVSAVLGDETPPFWLADRLAVQRGASWTVAAGRVGTARTLAAELPGVIRRVHQLVPQSLGAVIVYVPRDVDAMQETSGRVAGGVERLAGFVVSADGSTGRRAPVLVVLNPDQLVLLNQKGREAVLAHEITHAVTGVGVVEMPLWLAEGFADYVGVEVADVPRHLTSDLARRDVIEHGLPSAFPDNLAFGRSSLRDVELAYQQSRLAVVAMVDAFGERAVLRMYDRVVEHPDGLAGAVRAELGVSVGDVLRLWRAELRELSDG